MQSTCGLKNKWEENRNRICFSLLSTFIWGFLAHGYRFFRSDFSHDSLNEFSSAYGNNDWKIMLGRFVIPFYKEVFRTDLTLPWLIGILSLLWMGLAVFLVVKIFKMESKLSIFVVAGIFTANITVAATAASFIHDLDCDMFALLCAVTAVYTWRNLRWGSGLGAAFVAVALGIYQSYISVTITLVMLVCILDITDEAPWKQVFCNGMKAIAMILLGGALYYMVMQLVLTATGIELSSGGYNSLDKALELSLDNIDYLIFNCYRDCLSWLYGAYSPYPGALIKGTVLLMAAVAAGSVFAGLANKRISWQAKILCVCLIGLLPLGMNVTYILSGGMVHELMIYAVWLFYLLVLLLADRLVKRLKSVRQGRSLRYGTILLVFVLLYGNVQIANAMYLKKDMEQDAFLSLMTRVVYRMEEVEKYEPGITPVVFVGNTEQLNDVIMGFEDYCAINGMGESAVAGMQEDFRCRTYFRYILNNPANIVDGSTWSDMQADSRVREMPGYPKDGCIQMIDNVLVVKLGGS